MMRYERFGVLPTLSALYEAESVKEHAASNALLSQLDQSVIVPKMQQMPDYWSSATALGDGIVQGNITKENLQHYLDALVENITVAFISD